jgi:hypothetical protein
MTDSTLPGRHRRFELDDPFDAPTERLTTAVGADFDRFFPAASTGRHAAKEDSVPEPITEAQARQIVDQVAAATSVPEQDTDAGWARLAGVLGVFPAVA